MSDERLAYDHGQLPWLQPVEDEDEPRGVSAGRMLTALLVVLLLGALVAGGFFWLGRERAVPTGAPELIRAPATPYKIVPSDPGGLDVAGESGTAFETSAGRDPDAQIDTSRLPAGTTLPVQPAAPDAAAPKPAPAPAAPKPAATVGGKGSTIQLGAFGNRAQAERAWIALSGRFPAVAALNKSIVPFSGGIRLRASGANPAAAKAACDALKAAGENCFVVQ